jgi:transmembrane sensor
VVQPGARLRTLASTTKDLVLQLQSGKAHFSVRPGGPRRWVIEAGIVQVEVVGTEFSVERVQSGARVEVTRGVVLVRSRELKDGVERLEGGGQLTVGHWPGDPEPLAEAESEAAANGEKAVAPAEAAAEGASLAQAGSTEAAPTSVRQRPRNKQRRASIEKLLEQADEARISGNRAAAQRVLQRVVREFPGDPRAAISAFQLGALELELGQPQRAVTSLEVALERAGSLSLREDCYLRLVEAQLASGSVDRAQRVARSYRNEFPDGRHQGAIERLLQRSRTKKSGTPATKSR